MWIKAGFGAISVIIPLAFAWGCWLRYAGSQVTQSSAPRSAAIACSLNAADLAARRQQLASFRNKAREVRELENGFALRFAFDEHTLQESMQLIADESRCCGFLDFRLTARPSADLLLLEIMGPKGAKELLAANFPVDAADKPAAATTERSASPGCASEGANACSIETCLPARSPKEQ